MKRKFFILAGLTAFLFLVVLVFGLTFSNDPAVASTEEQLYEPATGMLPESPVQSVYSVPFPSSLSFAGEEVPLDIFYVREYLDRDLIVNTYFHSSTVLMMKRASRWFPMIERILAENGVPDDFKYLALIESGFENVTSPAGARGFWQFLKHTAREYGLEVNSGIDERDNPEKSTIAACKYLLKSYHRFGNWTLVAAAYNAGNRRISQELARQKADNYYELLLNQETARYVFRILAVKTIFENPEQYGFYLTPDELYPPLQTEIITVDQTVNNLIDFAISHGTNYKTLKLLNPWLKQDYLPNKSRRTYHLQIPARATLPALSETDD
jgi:membrane-bound lytic murein transglycosylase D